MFQSQVDVGLKQLSCHFMGGGTGAQHGVEAFAEANALQLKAQKPVRTKRNRRQRQQQSTEAQALYIVNVTTGILQVHIPGCSAPQCTAHISYWLCGIACHAVS